MNVIYHHFPHYRRPVMRELVKAGRHEYRFFGSLEEFDGIETFQGDELVKITPIRFKLWRKTWLLSGYAPALLDPTADVLVVHGHPNMPASWIIAVVGRLTGKKIVYWAHGWRRKESWLKSMVRNIHYGLAHRTMTYADRARDLAASTGFRADRVVAIYNSLDWSASRPIYEALHAEGTASVRRRLGVGDDVFRISCVARLTEACRFDLLLEAAALLKDQAKVEICLIGDGPERERLTKQAGQLSVDLKLPGPSYDERELGQQIFASDLTVSPGKIGLSAIHSLMYGTPVVSHDDMDSQMPEIEAIVPQVTGSLFKRGSAPSLADAIKYWMTAATDRELVRMKCQEVIVERYNPVVQAERIDATINAVLGQGSDKR